MVVREAVFCDEDRCKLVSEGKCLVCDKDICLMHTGHTIAFSIEARPVIESRAAPPGAGRRMVEVQLLACKDCFFHQGQAQDRKLLELGPAFIQAVEGVREVFKANQAADALKL